jgi:hypothetical protein
MFVNVVLHIFVVCVYYRHDDGSVISGSVSHVLVIRKLWVTSLISVLRR